MVQREKRVVLVTLLMVSLIKYILDTQVSKT